MMKRNLNIEALRVYMMLLIVLLHATGTYIDSQNIRSSFGFDVGWLFGYRSITFLGVTTFAFISGYYGVKLKLSKCLAMELMALTYGLVVLLLCVYKHTDITFGTIRNYLFPISSGNLWYFSCYMMLLIVSPMLNAGLEAINKSAFRQSLLIFMFIVYGFRFISGGANCDFYVLLLIYLIGRYLRKYPIPFLIKYRMYIFISLVLLNFILAFCLGYLGLGKLVLLLEGNNNPITGLAAVSLFYIFSYMKSEPNVNRLVSKLAPNMLAVYVFHELLRGSGVFDFHFLNGQLLESFAISVLVVLIISLVERVRIFLFSPLLKLLNKI